MASYKELFPRKHTVLPVIHAETPSQALRNVEVAHQAGADGAFLIRKPYTQMSHGELAKVHETVRREFSTWWLGINYLDLERTVEIFEHLTPSMSGVWADDARINEWVERQLEAEEIQQARKRSGWNGLYFGGVAFKYQRGVHKDKLAVAAQLATRFMDVVTTSGSATGSAPDTEKIAIMKAAIGDKPLAIASGVSPENVENYFDADCFLVATSLLKPETEDFDPSRVKDLIQAVRG